MVVGGFLGDCGWLWVVTYFSITRYKINLLKPRPFTNTMYAENAF